MRLDKDLEGWWPLVLCQHPVCRVDCLFSHSLIPSALLCIAVRLLSTYQNLKEVLVGDVGQLGAVEFGDDELFNDELASIRTHKTIPIANRIRIMVYSPAESLPGRRFKSHQGDHDRCGEGDKRARG